MKRLVTVNEDILGCLHILPTNKKLLALIKARVIEENELYEEVNPDDMFDVMLQNEEDIDFFWNNVSRRQKSFVDRGFNVNLLVNEDILGCLYSKWYNMEGILL